MNKKHKKKSKPVHKEKDDDLFIVTDEFKNVHEQYTWDADGSPRFGIPGDTH